MPLRILCWYPVCCFFCMALAVGVLTMKYAFDAKGFEKIELYLQKPLRLSNKIKQA